MDLWHSIEALIYGNSLKFPSLDPQGLPWEFWDPAKELHCWVSVSISQNSSAFSNPFFSQTLLMLPSLALDWCPEHPQIIWIVLSPLTRVFVFSDRNKHVSLMISHEKLITTAQSWTQSLVHNPEVALLPLLPINQRSWCLFQSPNPPCFSLDKLAHRFWRADWQLRGILEGSNCTEDAVVLFISVPPFPRAATDSQDKAKSNIWHLFPVQHNLPGSLTFFI